MNTMSEKLFTALDTLSVLKERRNSPSILSYSQIIQAILQPFSPAGKETLNVINTKLAYRKLYKQALARMGSMYAPRVKAASDQEHIQTRQTTEFKLQLNAQSTSRTNQTAAISIEVFNPLEIAEKHAFLYCFFKEKIFTLPLEKKENKLVADILTTEPIYLAIRHVDSELFVR